MRDLKTTKMKVLVLDTIRKRQGPPWMTGLPDTECSRMLSCCKVLEVTWSQREELTNSNCDNLGWYGQLSFLKGTLLKAHLTDQQPQPGTFCVDV